MRDVLDGVFGEGPRGGHVGSGQWQGELGRPGSCHEGPDYEVVAVAVRGWRTREWCPLGQRGGRPSHGLVGTVRHGFSSGCDGATAGFQAEEGHDLDVRGTPWLLWEQLKAKGKRRRQSGSSCQPSDHSTAVTGPGPPLPPPSLSLASLASPPRSGLSVSGDPSLPCPCPAA